MPKVSIIISAYNIENYIERCLESIVNQSFKEIEIIVINDGSTDNTSKMISRIAADDNRIIVINKQNEGIAEARKTGLKAASGQYVLFVDGDDWIHIETIHKLYIKALDEQADIVLYNFYFAYNDDYIKPGKSYDSVYDIEDYIKSTMLCLILPGICFKFINREFIFRNNIVFPSNIKYAEDLAATINISLHRPKVTAVDDHLYYYYQREDSVTKIVDEKIFDIPKAIEFIKMSLMKQGLFEAYKEEFNYLAFTHIFHNKIICTNVYFDLHKKMNDIWKRQKISLKENKYYVELRRKCSIVQRLKIDIFLYNYSLGVLCFKSIKVFKKYKNKVLFHFKFSN